MAIGGNKREEGTSAGFLKVGLARCKVLAFNPTKEQLEKILNVELKQDPEYLDEDVVTDEETGKTTSSKKLRLNVWLEELTSSMKICLRLTLIDKVQVSKTSKVRYVDTKGNTSYYIESEENLQDFMKENSPWKGRVGEYELFEFLKAWQNKIDRRTISDFTFNWGDLVSGKPKELNSWIGSEYEGDVLVLLCVKVNIETNEETGEKTIKEYQEVYNRNFLPGDAIRYFEQKGEIKSKYVNNFIKEVTNKEYGPKNFFGGTLGVMRDYVRDENPNATLDAFVPEDGAAAPQTADY
jgi:hypothetical protein